MLRSAAAAGQACWGCCCAAWQGEQALKGRRMIFLCKAGAPICWRDQPTPVAPSHRSPPQAARRCAGHRHLNPEYKLRQNIRIAMFYLEDDDAVNAENYIKKASSLIATSKVQQPAGGCGGRPVSCASRWPCTCGIVGQLLGASRTGRSEQATGRRLIACASCVWGSCTRSCMAAPQAAGRCRQCCAQLGKVPELPVGAECRAGAAVQDVLCAYPGRQAEVPGGRHAVLRAVAGWRAGLWRPPGASPGADVTACAGTGCDSAAAERLCSGRPAPDRMHAGVAACPSPGAG